MPRTFIRAFTAVALLAIGACTTEPGGGGGTPVTINWAQCINDPNTPAWFAFQDGTGSWTKVASTAGVFTFTVSSGKVGVATYASGQLSILYATTTELNNFKPSCTGSVRPACTAMSS